MQAVCLALDFARANAGNNSAAKMAMIAMTTNNSIKVNASLVRLPQREPGETQIPFQMSLRCVANRTAGYSYRH